MLDVHPGSEMEVRAHRMGARPLLGVTRPALLGVLSTTVDARHAPQHLHGLQLPRPSTTCLCPSNTL
jgi:hypothetical protein